MVDLIAGILGQMGHEVEHMTPFEVLNKIQNDHKCEVFPYVGLISENKKVLSELYPEFKDWLTNEKSSKEKRKKRGPGKGSGDWMNMFDDADAKVRGGLSMFDEGDAKVRDELTDS